jgi:Adenylate and Guanylate cyclase catalytic domain
MSGTAERLPPDSPQVHTAAWWLDAVKREERRGELLAAFDLAERGLAEHPDDLWLKHRAVLALARAGGTEEAARRFEQYGLVGIPDEDIAALRARIAKDVALGAEGDERRRGAARAADLYGAIFSRTGGYYPAINAATLWLVSGDVARARELAAVVLARLDASGDGSYYAVATEGEAHLLLGDAAAAREALARAAALHGEDFGALATTRRQLRTICELLGLDPQLLSVLAGPAVVHFCGHRIANEHERGRFPSEAEAIVAARIAEVVQRHPAGYAYGSLANGADILWAEALLARGSELYVILPFARAEFIEQSVAPSGSGWVDRFERCLTLAASVRYATDDAFLGDDVLFRYCSELAMGLAVLRARYLDAEVRQLAVWDGGPARGAAGTSIDVATWRAGGRPVTLISPDTEALVAEADGSSAGAVGEPIRPQAAVGEPTDSPAPGEARGRIVRAMLFGDVKGFSKLTDEQLPIFASLVLGAFASALRQHQAEVWHRNTWGDAVYVVLSNATAAAACALDLQDAMMAIDLQAEGLPAHLALRLGGHIGPVFPTHDPVLDEPGFMGSHVSRTARIEPVTPPGTVYVTEPFAAALVLDGRSEFVCDYVGHMAAAKDYGRLRMYRLRRTVGLKRSTKTSPSS